jgi:hypothetical protein
VLWRNSEQMMQAQLCQEAVLGLSYSELPKNKQETGKSGLKCKQSAFGHVQSSNCSTANYSRVQWCCAGGR